MPECAADEKKVFPIIPIFLTGFLLGVLFPNVIWKTGWRQSTVSAFYLFGICTVGTETGKALLWEVVKKRGSLFVLSVLCGLTSFGVPWAVILSLFAGAEMGTLLTMSILEFGLKGGVLGAGFFLPQYLFYFPVMVRGLELVCGQSQKIWKNHGLYPRTTYRYLLRMLGLLVIFTIGILSEAYVNPQIVRLFLKFLKY